VVCEGPRPHHGIRARGERFEARPVDGSGEDGERRRPLRQWRWQRDDAERVAARAKAGERGSAHVTARACGHVASNPSSGGGASERDDAAPHVEEVRRRRERLERRARVGVEETWMASTDAAQACEPVCEPREW